MTSKIGGKNRLSYLLVALSLFLISISFFNVFTEGATSVTSCEPVTSDIILANDVIATGSCFDVQSNDLTIDCDFFKVEGDGSGSGIDINNKSGIKIINCNIENFDTGLNITNSSPEVLFTKFSDNNQAILSKEVSNPAVSYGTFLNNGLNINNTNNESIILDGFEVLVDVFAQNNYWGTLDTVFIESKLIGAVSYLPILTEDPLLDGDSDNVIQILDNCPNVANFDQSDIDGDGLGDLCDNCINEFNNDQLDTDNDGEGNICDLDDDNDLLCDEGPSVIDTSIFNKALNKPVIASSFSAPNTPNLSVDGDYNTFWGVSDFPIQTLEIDLEELIYLDQINIYFDDLNSLADQYTIELSSDNETFTQINSISENSDTLNQYFYTDTEGRYLRFTFESWDFVNYDLAVSEIEVFGGTLICNSAPSGVDVCPLIPDPMQNDTDNDSVGDLCDNCVNDFNPFQEDYDGDGKGDACDANLQLGIFSFDPVNEGITLNPNLTVNETSDEFLYVIQLNDVSIRDATFTEISATEFGYIPQNAYLINSSLNDSEILNNSNVRSLEVYQPAYKLSAGLYNEFLSGGFNNNTPDTYNVLYLENKTNETKQKILDENWFINSELPGMFVVTIAKSDMLELLKIPEVLSVGIFREPKYKNDIARVITHVQEVNLGTVQFGQKLEGDGVKVNILDSGLDVGVPCSNQSDCTTKNPGIQSDFAGRILELRRTDGSIGPVNDTDGHGTHVAGTAIGDGTLSPVATQYQGVAPKATFAMQKRISNSTLGLVYGISNNYKIHSNSWGGKECFFQYTTDARLLDNLLFNANDSVFAFAAGNENTAGKCPAPAIIGQNTIQPESVGKNVFAIGASENNRAALGTVSNDPEDIVFFSSRGPPSTPTTANTVRIKPDIVAPGSNILSTRSSICIPDAPSYSSTSPAGITFGPNSYNVNNACLSPPQYGTPTAARYACLTSASFIPQGGAPALTPAQVTAARAFMLASDTTDFNSDNVDNTGGSMGVLDHADCRGWGLPASAAIAQNYYYQGGTSMATPHVSGALAITKEYLKKVKSHPDPSGSLLRGILINGAEDIGGQGTAAGMTGTAPNNDQGWGRLHLADSLYRNGTHTTLYFVDYDSAPALAVNKDVNYSEIDGQRIRFSSGRNTTITLTWYDQPAAALSDALVNDLDLILLAPNGDKYRGNVYDASGKSMKQGAVVQRDAVNNVEKIKLEVPEDGLYNISVKAMAIGGSAQKFSLIVSPMLGIDAADENYKIKTHFPVGSKIKARAVGLRNNTAAEVAIFGHNKNFTWNKTMFLTNGAGVGVNGMNFVTTKSITTTDNGTIEDTEIIWDTTGNESVVFDNNGSFNMMVNYGVGHPIRFDFGEDIVDYPKRRGFTVYAINSSKSSANNDFEDNFTYGNTVHVFGRGLPPSKPPVFKLVDIYVFKDKNWANGAQLTNEVVSKKGHPTGFEGTLRTNIWVPKKEDGGKYYDIVVDVNRDGIYQEDTDIIDGKTTKGFFVDCKPGEVACGSADSADASGAKKDTFLEESSVSSVLEGVFKFASSVTGYLVPSNSPVTDLENATLADIEVRSSPTVVSVTPNEAVSIVEEMWPDAEEGDFEMIWDADGNGIFNADIDIFDADGFIVTKELKWVAIDVDSSNNLHIVAVNTVDNGYGGTNDQIVYSKVESGDRPKVDLSDPELFEWAESRAAVFKVIAINSGGSANFPDIAVDSNDEPYIVFGRHFSGFNWLIVEKLDKNGNPDFCFDRSDQLTPPAPNMSNCDGNGRELLYYHWDDFEDIKLNFPKITVDPITDYPVLSADVSMIFPDAFYYTHIYPSCFLDINLVPVVIHPLVPPVSVLDLVSIPITFFGEQIAIAKRNPGSSGTVQWPYGAVTYSEASQRYQAAATEVNNCIGDIATVAPRGDENWKWITVSEGHTSSASFDFSDLVASEDGIHVVYRGKEDPDEPSDPRRLYYSQIIDDSVTPDIQISSSTPNSGAPSIDIDLENRAHITWQSGDKIYYDFVESGGSPNGEIVVETVSSNSVPGRPVVAADASSNPHILYLDEEASNTVTLNYVEGEFSAGSASFPNDKVVLETTEDLSDSPSPDISFPAIASNRKAHEDDWTNRVHVAWVESNLLETVKHKRTVPRIVMLLVADGFPEELLFDNLSDMPDLESLLNEHISSISSVSPHLPATTSSTHASILTGLEYKNHKVIGDQFPTASSGDVIVVPDSTNPNSLIEPVLSDVGATTIYGYLASEGKSTAAIPALVTKDIGSGAPNRDVPAQTDFINGEVTNSFETLLYLLGRKNNDLDDTNDIADFLSVYLLNHDHGVNDQIDIVDFNDELRKIINELKINFMYNDTLFVITSDHSFQDQIIASDVLALDNSDLVDLDNPNNVPLNNLLLNGRLAYSNDGLSQARVYYNNSNNVPLSEWYNAIENIYVKEGGEYKIYHFNGTDDVLMSAPGNNVEHLFFAGSPNIILEASPGVYFNTPRRYSYGDSEAIPFIVTGAGYDYYLRGTDDISSGFAVEDIAPTLAYFVAGQNAVDAMASVDGKNIFEPDLTIEGGSPVDFHLYDSANRHVGPNIFGNIELEIPGSNYEIDPKTGKKKITLLRSTDDYVFQVESFGYGKFALEISQNREGNQFTVVYPKTIIEPNSIGRVDLSGNLNLELDLEGDGSFEQIFGPTKLIIVNQNESNSSADVSIVKLPSQDSVLIDLVDSTNSLIEINNVYELENDEISVSTISDESLTTPSFFTFNNYLQIVADSEVFTNSESVKLSVVYPDYELLPLGLSEKSIAIYNKDTLEKLESVVDEKNNVVTTELTASGNYLVAATDRIPRIENIHVNPTSTNILNEVVFVSAQVTDDSIINEVTVTLGNNTENLTFNASSGEYEGLIIGPTVSDTYPVIITAYDDTENINTKQSSFKLDLDPPVINIFSPEQTNYITNRINLIVSFDEEATASYKIDGGSSIPIWNITPNRLITIPLTFGDGSHDIEITASDIFVNTNTTNISFFVEKENIAINDLDAELFVKPNSPFVVSAKASNTMIDNETNVTINLLVDGVISQSQNLDIPGESIVPVDFIVNLPEGRYNITIESVPLNEEGFTDDNSLTTEVLVTDKVPVLIVDDDESKDAEVYKNAVQNTGGLGYEYVSHNIETQGLPNFDIVKKFPVLIWFSEGDETGEGITLSPLETDLLSDYLDSRGKLILFGDNIGKTAGSSSFYEAYLFAQYKGEAVTTTIEGAFRDDVGGGLLFSLTEPGEEIVELTPSTESLRYSGGDSAGIKVDTGVFKVAYFTFDLDQVEDQSVQETLIERTLEYFGVDIFPPVISNLDPELYETFPINTTNLTLSLDTDEYATCRYSDNTTEFELMTEFTVTGGTTHNDQIFNLQNGVNYTIYISCRDIFGNENSNEFFNFYIHNRTFLPPVLSPIPNFNETENSFFNYTINVTDPENDTLTITLEDTEIFGFTPIAADIAIVGTTMQLNINYEMGGAYILRVNIDDGFDVVSQEFSLIIENVNRPPVINTIPNQLAMEDTYYILTVVGNDPDGEDIIFSDNTTLFDINPITGVISFNPKNDQVDQYLINIAATDGDLEDNEEFLLTITNENDPPTIEPIPPQTATKDIEFNLQINGSDPDNDTLSYSDNSTLFNISSDGFINFTPTALDLGTHIIDITATDGLENDSKILNLVILGENSAPIITSITDMFIVLRNDSFDINVTACDPDLEVCP